MQALEFIRDTMNGIGLSKKVVLAWLSDTDPDVTQINVESADLPPIQPINLSSEGPLLGLALNSNFGGVVLKMMISFAVGLVAVFFTQKFSKQ